MEMSVEPPRVQQQPINIWYLCHKPCSVIVSKLLMRDSWVCIGVFAEGVRDCVGRVCRRGQCSVRRGPCRCVSPRGPSVGFSDWSREMREPDTCRPGPEGKYTARTKHEGKREGSHTEWGRRWEEERIMSEEPHVLCWAVGHCWSLSLPVISCSWRKTITTEKSHLYPKAQVWCQEGTIKVGV